MKYQYLIMFTIFLLNSCQKENSITTDSTGTIIAQNELWKFPLHKDNVFFSNGIIGDDIWFDKGVTVITTEGENNHFVKKINIETGKEEWKWRDFILPDERWYAKKASYKTNNYFIFHDSRKTYSIDLKTGQTIFKKNHGEKFYDPTIWGMGDYVLLNGHSDSTNAQARECALFSCHVKTGEIKELFKPKYSGKYANPLNGWNRIGAITGVVPQIDAITGDTLLATFYSEPQNLYDYETFLGLYNLSKKAWIYERKNTIGVGYYLIVRGTPIVNDNRTYVVVGNEVICNDLFTGTLLWRYKMNSALGSSDYIIRDGKLYILAEDAYLYCVDVNTGTLRWKTEAASTSSTLRYLNGFIYFLGGSPNRLFAINALTGVTSWKMPVPEAEKKEFGKTFYIGGIFAIQGENGQKGKIVACTSMFAYCYDAIQ